MCIFLPWMIGVGDRSEACSHGLHANDLVHFVKGDSLRHVRFEGQKWKQTGDSFSASGKGNALILDHGWKGPFEVEIVLQLKQQKESAAGIRLNDSFFGLEGKRAREVFGNGPLFGGYQEIAPSKSIFPAGDTIQIRIESTDVETRFLINGKVVTRRKPIPSVERFELVPWRAQMIVSKLTVLSDDFFELPQSMDPGYTIPTIDLSADKQRQILVDREPGQYLGHPTTVLLEDQQTMICVYPKGHGRGPIVMKRSTDGGRTWSERLATPRSWATSKETPTIHRVVDADGKKRLILFSGLYPIRISVSEDDGKSWSELKPIGDFGGIVAMGCVEQIGPGKYMALFHDDGRFIRDGGTGKRKFKVYKTVSEDGGLTWSDPVVIATHPTAHLCEPGLIRSPDQKQITVLLRENSRRQNSFMIQSNDEGQTWTDPVELPAALTGDRHTGKYAPDGRLFISFRDTTRATPTPGDWVGWVGTYEDIVQGREGQYRVRLMDNKKGKDCAYPGVEVLADGTFVTTTYGHWTENEPPYIMSVRFKLSELDALAAKLKSTQPKQLQQPRKVKKRQR